MGVIKAGTAVIGMAGGSDSGQKRVPFWAKALFVASIIAMVAGLVLPMLHSGSPSGVGGGFNIPATAAAALTGDPDADGALAVSDGPVYVKTSPMMFRAGFGFFVGFVSAFAMRAYLRTALISVGFFLITGFGLQHEGLVDVKWTQVEERYAKIRTELGDGAWRTPERTDALTQALPTLAAAGFGLVVGFLRRKD